MKNIRNDFPIFKKLINGHPLIYLDNAATAQKPQAVLDAMHQFYSEEYGTVSRSVYPLAERATERYESARSTLARFINARTNELIFTSGSTHGMNILAFGWGMRNISRGDEIVLAEWEHHSTLLPWQHVAMLKHAIIRYIPVLPNGTLDLSTLDSIITKKTKAVIISHISNVFGTLIPLEIISKRAREVGARIILDAAQSAPHGFVDVKKSDVDALVFSGHKMGGPTGIGVLYIAERLHEEVPPYHLGGGMVYEASFDQATWRKAPYKFEAGTPPFAQAIGLAAAVDYWHKVTTIQEIRLHEAHLCKQLIDGLSLIARARVYGPVGQLITQGHLVSFALEGVHPHDVAAFLGEQGICVRAGNLCAQPLAQKLSIPGLIRASFYRYNTADDVTRLLEQLNHVLHLW